MTDKSFFSADEWSALAEAPLFVTLAVVAVGEHGPISMVKEASASARTMAQPGDRYPANELIAAIAKDAEGHEARHDVSQHRGKSFDETVDHALARLQAAKAALDKIPPEEAAQVAAWFVDIGRAVAGAAKGTNEHEAETIGRISAALGVAATS
ncbi:MAG: hypothetical protein ACHQNA_14160 [Acidimicrobiales bacterium]